MVHPRGFEPLTFCSGGKRSIQLSYGRTWMRLAPLLYLNRGRLVIACPSRVNACPRRGELGAERRGMR